MVKLCKTIGQRHPRTIFSQREFRFEKTFSKYRGDLLNSFQNCRVKMPNAKNKDYFQAECSYKMIAQNLSYSRRPFRVLPGAAKVLANLREALGHGRLPQSQPRGERNADHRQWHAVHFFALLGNARAARHHASAHGVSSPGRQQLHRTVCERGAGMVLRGGKPLCDIDKLFGKLSLFPGEQPLERFSKFSTYPKQNCCSDLHLSVLHGGEIILTYSNALSKLLLGHVESAQFSDSPSDQLPVNLNAPGS